MAAKNPNHAGTAKPLTGKPVSNNPRAGSYLTNKKVKTSDLDKAFEGMGGKKKGK